MKIPKKPRYKKMPKAIDSKFEIRFRALGKKILESENYTEEMGRDFGYLKYYL